MQIGNGIMQGIGADGYLLQSETVPSLRVQIKRFTCTPGQKVPASCNYHQLVRTWALIKVKVKHNTINKFSNRRQPISECIKTETTEARKMRITFYVSTYYLLLTWGVRKDVNLNYIPAPSA